MKTFADDASFQPEHTHVEHLDEAIARLLETPGVSGVDIMDVDPSRYIEIIETARLTGEVMAAR